MFKHTAGYDDIELFAEIIVFESRYDIYILPFVQVYTYVCAFSFKELTIAPVDIPTSNI